MNDAAPSVATSRITSRDWAIWGGSLAFLWMILHLHLLAAVLSGLLVFELVRAIAPRLRVSAIGSTAPQIVAVSLIALAVITALALGIGALVGFLRDSGENLPALFERMALIIEGSRSKLPVWLLAYMPDSAEELRVAVVDWLRSNAGTLQLGATTFGRTIAHVLIGMIAGAMIALHLAEPESGRAALAAVLTEQAGRLATAFRSVVFAQFWISTVNTALTWIYLSWVLPAFGVELPFRGLLVLVTFFCGLLPILGNIISNTVIFVFSLSHSLLIALVSLGYLVVIHKLEYFLNARIIGSHIRARAWELLTAMLIMEAAFGIPGLIAAPIFYCFIKDSLRDKALL